MSIILFLFLFPGFPLSLALAIDQSGKKKQPTFGDWMLKRSAISGLGPGFETQIA